MAINIDKVYQKVLSLANKEQRGYIGAKDFNNFAELAQLDIIDQYFYDLNQIYRAQGNDNEYSNIIDLIQEKISYISKTATISAAGEKVTDLYKLGSVYLNYPALYLLQAQQIKILSILLEMEKYMLNLYKILILKYLTYRCLISLNGGMC